MLVPLILDISHPSVGLDLGCGSCEGVYLSLVSKKVSPVPKLSTASTPRQMVFSDTQIFVKLADPLAHLERTARVIHAPQPLTLLRPTVC